MALYERGAGLAQSRLPVLTWPYALIARDNPFF
jgi:hypothetical protein